MKVQNCYIIWCKLMHLMLSKALMSFTWKRAASFITALEYSHGNTASPLEYQ